MVQLMSNFGIHAEDDAQDDFGSFVNGVYQSCKDLDISPSAIPSWMKDLDDCHLSDQPFLLG
jgi:hypothetical protein